jgi:hypothetical protein
VKDGVLVKEAIGCNKIIQRGYLVVTEGSRGSEGCCKSRDASGDEKELHGFG